MELSPGTGGAKRLPNPKHAAQASAATVHPVLEAQVMQDCITRDITFNLWLMLP